MLHIAGFCSFSNIMPYFSHSEEWPSKWDQEQYLPPCERCHTHALQGCKSGQPYRSLPQKAFFLIIDNRVRGCSPIFRNHDSGVFWNIQNVCSPLIPECSRLLWGCFPICPPPAPPSLRDPSRQCPLPPSPNGYGSSPGHTLAEALAHPTLGCVCMCVCC